MRKKIEFRNALNISWREFKIIFSANPIIFANHFSGSILNVERKRKASLDCSDNFIKGDRVVKIFSIMKFLLVHFFSSPAIFFLESLLWLNLSKYCHCSVSASIPRRGSPPDERLPWVWGQTWAISWLEDYFFGQSRWWYSWDGCDRRSHRWCIFP